MSDLSLTSAQVYQPVPRPKQQSALMRGIITVLPPLAVAALLLLLYAWIRSNLEEHRLFLMPSATALWENAFSRPEVWADLGSRALVTISIALAGLAISIPLGIVVGLIMYRFFVLERGLFPNIVALQAIPMLAVIPLIQTALGFGFMPKMLIVAKMTFFAIPTTLLLGLKSVDRGAIDLFRLQNANWFVMLWKCALPSAAPSLFAGLRISASMAVVGAIVSELFFLAGKGGLGQMIINSKIDFKYEQMYAALIASTLLSVGVYLFFSWLGNRLFSEWHESGGKQG